MQPPKVNTQGKVVVERDTDGYLVMFPDGCIERFFSKRGIERAAKTYSKKHQDSDSINVLQIEWRS